MRNIRSRSAQALAVLFGVFALSGGASAQTTAFPMSLTFSNVPVGTTSANQTVTLTNNSASSILISGLSVTAASPYSIDPSSTCLNPTVGVGGSCTVVVKMSPLSSGAQVAGVLNITAVPGSDSQTVSLNGTGVIPPTVSLSFNPTQIASGATSVATVSLGNANATSLSGASFTDTLVNMSAVSGAVGGTCAGTLPTNLTAGTTALSFTGITIPPAGCTVTFSVTSTNLGANPNSTSGVTSTQTPVAGSVSNTASLIVGGAGQVILTSPANPVLVGANITIAGTGYPTGTITAAATSVVVTPSAGNGSPVSIQPSAPLTPTTSNRNVIFKLPASLSANLPYTATVSVSGQTTANTPFSTATPATITINPAGSLTSVSPSAGQVGTAVSVTIMGQFTHFAQATSIVSVSGTGVVPSGMIVAPGSSTQLSVTLTIAPGATPGPYAITVTTGSEVATMPVGFVVTTGAGLSFASVGPSSAPQGTVNLMVDIQGINTNFAQGVTTANFGDGITINNIVVNTPTDMDVFISIDPIAVIGGRNVTVVTGGQFASDNGGFSVTASDASILTALPATPIPQGGNGTVNLVGHDTHWTTSGTQVSFGGGINAGSILVVDNTHLTVNFSVSPSTGAGGYGVTVTTHGEVVSLANAVTVTAATPFLSGVLPTSGVQGATNLDVIVTGTFTSFTTGAISANFGPLITVNHVTPTSATSADINISIDPVAGTGGRSVSLTSNGTIFSFSFSVTGDGATVTSVTPNNGLQQSSVALQVTGLGTHWVQGTTTASLGDPYITINRIIVNSPTTAEVDITLGAQAGLGLHGITMTTGGENASKSGVFTVLPFTPSLSLAPGSGMIGTTVNVNINGSFTHFATGTTELNIDGEGIQLMNFQVLGPSTAKAQFIIASTAPASPSLACSPGNRTVTMTTGNEIVTAPFCVTSTPAVLTGITPGHSPTNVNNLTVEITGAYTHFGPTTTVGFGPNITVGTPNVLGTGDLKVVISIDPSAALGWRQAYVNTGTEQLTIGFLIDSPASASLVSVVPSSGAQGQSISGVTITGNLTNFTSTAVNPLNDTIAIIGAGITVSNLQILSNTVATADISISPTTQPGGRTVEMITGAEDVAGGLFGVTPGIATMTFTPNCNNANAIALICSGGLATVEQGGIVPFNVLGGNTHFVQGETTMDFGGGIVVTQLTVTDSTHITGQIAVSYTAPIGYHQVTVTTDGEVALANSDALDVIQTTSTSLNITPTTGQQGTSHLQIQMNGQLTNWINGNTSATFGNNNGLVVNSVTVSSPTQAVIDLTIQGTAYVGLYSLTVNTTHAGNPEQESLTNVFSVGPGVAIITTVVPSGSSAQSTTESIAITGQNTSWINGVTTAYFTTGGCSGSPNPGVNVANVTVADTTHATLSIAISPTALTGLQTLCMTTLGESVNFQNSFTISPGNPTLNGVTPVNAEQGTTVTLNIIGQFTHWLAGQTAITFGEGITATGPLNVTSTNSASVQVAVDPLADIGPRDITLTTPLAAGGYEIVQGTQFFSIIAGPAILSSVSPTMGNQGQHILMQVNGENTHWAQGLSQVTINGAGGDITINGVQVQSQTTLVMDFNISPTANLGLRTVYVSTGGEVVSDSNSFIVTGGIPSISSISPSSSQQGSTAVNVQISGIYTKWDATTLVSFGPNITFGTPAWTVNSNTSITAVINIPNGAPLGLQTITIQTGTQILTSSFNILSNAPPTPYISYEYPSVALVGQTLSVSLVGQYTHWLPGSTNITFGAGIVVNNFQVTGENTAIANITIANGATLGTRTVQMITGSEKETTYFTVTVGTPQLTLISPGSIIQGQTLDVDIVGQYTSFNCTTLAVPMSPANCTTVFGFSNPGITLNTITYYGPTAVRVNVSAGITASLGGMSVSATTGSEVAYNYGAGFSVTPSQATITQVTPNTAPQNAQPVVQVVGFQTHWDNTTNFTLGGIGITQVVVNTPTTATLTLSIPPLAYVGEYALYAQTGGEQAYLNNAFVVTPGTPILVSATGASVQQGQNFSTGILGQLTSFVAGWPAAGATTVSLGTGVNVTGVNVTANNAITVTGNADPLSYPGGRNITVTTGSQVLVLFGAFYVSPGTAAISQLSPNVGGQSLTTNVEITGTNTHFQQNVTTGSFGPGISLNTLTINSLTDATANITIAANAVVEQNNVTLYTLGETATIQQGFTIVSTTAIIDFINPTSLPQGATSQTITLAGSFTNWVDGNTVADFGPGITVNPTHASSNIAGTAVITISPVAALGVRTPRMITNLGGGAQEIAIKQNAFTVTAGNSTISSITTYPTPGTTVHQNDSGDVLLVTGNGTHFTLATITNGNVVFCNGVSTAAVVVVDDLHLRATVNVGTFAPVGACGVTVTTGGEVAASGGTFIISAGVPVITQVNPNSAIQGQQTVQVNVTGLYTHFTSGAFSISIPGATPAGGFTVTNDTSAYGTFNFSNTATTGVEDVTVSDTTDGNLVDHNAFTVNPGVPALLSVVQNTLGQGLTATITLTGAFTHFSSSSLVTVSGVGVTVGSIVGSPTATSLQIPFTVTLGAAATARNVTVTTGGEVVTLNSSFTVLPGTANISLVSPNIGVPNSTITMNFTGVFTNWVQGTTMAKIGLPSGLIQVNGAAAGTQALITVTSATTATAQITIEAGAPIQTNDVHVITGGQDLLVGGGFQVLTSTTTPPTVTFVTPSNGATGIPTNTNITVVFSEPLNPATVPTNGANAFVGTSGPWAVSGVPASVSLDASGRIMTIIPTSPLAIGTGYYIQLNSYSIPAGTPTIQDQSGNALGHYYYSFTAGLGPVSVGPQFVSANIAAGVTGVPTNLPNITLSFNQAINPATQPAALSVTSGAVPVVVPGNWSYNSTFTQAIFTPTSWTASTQYTVNYGPQLQNFAGLGITNNGSFTFTTGTGTDSVSGGYISWTPPQGSAGTPTTGTKPTIRFIYNKPVNPLTVTPANFIVTNQANNIAVPATGVIASADNMTFTLVLGGPLLPGTNYHWALNGAYDWTGNYFSGAVNFTTNAGPDTTAPFVSTISPSAAVACSPGPCAPINSTITVQFSEWMDPTSYVPGAITLTPTAPAGPAVTVTPSFSSDFTCSTPSSSGSCNFTRLSIRPSANLNPNTTYQVAIPDNMLADLSGNFDPFTSSFTTGSSSTADTTHGTITSITPTSNSTNVSVNTAVVMQLNKAVNPLTLNSSSFRVYDNTVSAINVPGNTAISTNQQTITFTPLAALEPGHQYCAYGSYFSSFYDLAGNYFNGTGGCFTTAAGTDNTVPQVLSVTPLNNATGIGPNNPVIVTFSKPMNPNSFSNNVAIYVGSTIYVGNSYSYSGDGTTLVFGSGYLPYNTTFTVVVNPAVTDLAGNPMAAEFSSTFTTMAAPVTAQPYVSTFRPGNGPTGVLATNPITFFMSAPMNPATITSSTLVISQNGTQIAGTVAVTGNGQNVTFTPTGGAFAAGAYIQVFFTSGATDINGNALQSYQNNFTIAASTVGVGPSMVARGPCGGYCTVNDLNTGFEILFSKALNPATVTSSNFFVASGFNATPLVAGTLSVLDGGRLVRFQPTSPLSPNTYYTVWATTALQDTTGLSYVNGNNSSYQYYVYSGTGSNSAPPSVSATAPTNGATAIGTNSVVSVTFSENVDQNTLDPSVVSLAGPGGNIPISLGYSSSNYTMTITPQSPLPPSATVTLTLNGVTDIDGDALNPTPFTNLSFTTMAGPDFNGPVFVSSNISSNQSNVPVNTSVSLFFNKPIDWRSVIVNNSIYFQDVTAGSPNVPVVLSQIGNSGILITPNSALSVGHQYRVYLPGSLADLNGNTGGSLNFSFYTVLSAPAGGPVVTQMIPVSGSTVPVNFSPMVQFDRPVSPTALTGITLTQGGSPVAATVQLSSGGTVATLVPNVILQPGLPYVFTVTGTQDAAGNSQSGSVTRSFNTGTGIEITSPSFSLGSPIYNSTTGTNPELLATFNEQINPITINTGYLYNVTANSYVNGVTLTWSADMKSVRFNYPGSLLPQNRYYFTINSFCNIAGYCSNLGAQYFYTGTGADSSPEAVTSVNPPSGATTPTNPAISLVLAKPAAPASVTNSSVTLSPAAPAGTTVSLSTDGYTLTLNLGGTLTPSIPYTLNVAQGAFTDQDGNPVSAFSSGFNTGSSAETAGTHGTIALTSPAPGATGVPVTATITLTFSAPINPNSLTGDYFKVFDTNNGNYPIAGTITMPTANTLLFTPVGPLPSNTGIYIYASYYVSITDYAGNSFNNLGGASFTTATTAEPTGPQVVSFSPGSGATGVGPTAPVSITFSEALDYTTTNNANFALFNGESFVNPGISYSSDHKTVYLNLTLGYGTTYQVAVNTGVKDLAGNNMANAYQATFTTQNRPLTSQPSVIQSRPGNGAAVTSSITMFTNAPMNLSSVQAGMYVAQNGVLIPGNPVLTADLQGIVWTPNASFQPGALIEVYLTPTATDTFGNAIANYKFSFTTASNVTGAPTEVSVVPSRYNTSLYFTNPEIDVVFSRPLNPATVTSSTFIVSLGSGPGGTVYTGTLSLANNNTEVRFVPSTPFPVGQYYYVTMTTGIQDTAANAFAGDGYYNYIQPSAALDNTPPTVIAVTPANTDTGIGDNAPVRLIFSKLMNTNSINPSTVQLLNGATPLPYTASFTTYNGSNTQTVVTMMPQAALPDSSTITVQLGAGVTDQTGSAIAAQSTTFQTMAGADFTPATVVRQSIDNDNYANIGTNSTFTFVFSKPLDPASLNANTSGSNTNGFYIYNSNGNPNYPAIHANLSADGKTVTIVPNSALSPGATNDYVYVNNALDLSGNVISGTQQRFTTAAAANVTGPTIVTTNPTNTLTGAATNVSIEVIFSAPVTNTSLGQITLTGGANGPYSTYLENGSPYTNDTVVRIYPQQLLLPNTTYTVTVAGVTDTAGNAASGTTFTFTTGPNYQFNDTNFVSATVTTTGGTVPLPSNTVITNVLDSPTFVLTFDHAIDPIDLYFNGINLRDVNYNPVPSGTVSLNYVLSADQKTVTITTSGFAAATTYRLFVNYYIATYDSAGYQLQNSAQLYFTTQ